MFDCTLVFFVESPVGILEVGCVGIGGFERGLEGCGGGFGVGVGGGGWSVSSARIGGARFGGAGTDTAAFGGADGCHCRVFGSVSAKSGGWM